VPDLSAKKSNFLSRTVSAASALKSARDALVALEGEWNDYGYAASLQDADCVGSNAHLSLAIVTGLFTTQGNLESFWAAGNGTNTDQLTP
jgi:hypothetical protein